MRRADREITDFRKIIEIIDECDVLRLGLENGDYPYIVPVNFGYTTDGEEISFYFHGAMAGKKFELLKKNPHCSFEMDVEDCIVKVGNQYTTHYKSVIGEGFVEFLEDEKKKAVLEKYLIQRYDPSWNLDDDSLLLERTAVGELKVTAISAKMNPVE